MTPEFEMLVQNIHREISDWCAENVAEYYELEPRPNIKRFRINTGLKYIYIAVEIMPNRNYFDGNYRS